MHALLTLSMRSDNSQRHVCIIIGIAIQAVANVPNNKPIRDDSVSRYFNNCTYIRTL